MSSVAHAFTLLTLRGDSKSQREREEAGRWCKQELSAGQVTGILRPVTTGQGGQGLGLSVSPFEREDLLVWS